jgi:hypothetical protein
MRCTWCARVCDDRRHARGKPNVFDVRGHRRLGGYDTNREV